MGNTLEKGLLGHKGLEAAYIKHTYGSQKRRECERHAEGRVLWVSKLTPPSGSHCKAQFAFCGRDENKRKEARKSRVICAWIYSRLSLEVILTIVTMIVLHPGDTWPRCGKCTIVISVFRDQALYQVTRAQLEWG